MATKSPPASIVITSPVLTFRTRAPDIRFPLPRISSTTVFQTTEIFGLPRTRCCMIFEARNWSRRWRRMTLLTIFAR